MSLKELLSKPRNMNLMALIILVILFFAVPVIQVFVAIFIMLFAFIFFWKYRRKKVSGYLGFNRIKLAYLLAMFVIILITGMLAQNVIYCIVPPCDQPASTLISQQIYSIASFNLEYINPDLSYVDTPVAVGIKNFVTDLSTASAGTVYLIISLIVGMIVHYLIITVIYYFYLNLRKPKGSQGKKKPAHWRPWALPYS